ncbi:MAG: hypothetical protein R3D63_14765, partial [Paracoccaceae bacterium]
ADIAASRARGVLGHGQITEATSELPGLQAETWKLPFNGMSPAELAIAGNGASNLDLVVTDEWGNVVCVEAGPEDRAYCAFTPEYNGFFLASVTNRGEATNRYRLMTN